MAKSKKQSAENIQNTTMRGNDDIMKSSIHDEVSANAEMVTVVVTLADTLEDFSALTGNAFDALLKELRNIPESQRDLIAMQERAYGQLVEVAALLSTMADDETDPERKKAIQDAVAAMIKRGDSMKSSKDDKAQTLKENIGERYMGLRPKEVRNKGLIGATGMQFKRMGRAIIGKGPKTTKEDVEDRIAEKEEIKKAADLAAADPNMKQVSDELEGASEKDNDKKSHRVVLSDGSGNIGGEGSRGNSLAEQTLDNIRIILAGTHKEVTEIKEFIKKDKEPGADGGDGGDGGDAFTGPGVDATIDTPQEPAIPDDYLEPHKIDLDSKGSIGARNEAKSRLPGLMGTHKDFAPKAVTPDERSATTGGSNADSGEGSSGGRGKGFGFGNMLGLGAIAKTVGAILNPVTKIMGAAVAGFAIGEGINKLLGQQSATKTILEHGEAKQIERDSQEISEENQARTSTKLQQNMAKDGFTGTEEEYMKWQHTPEGTEARNRRMLEVGTPQPKAEATISAATVPATIPDTITGGGRTGTGQAVETAKEKEDRIQQEKEMAAQAPTIVNNNTTNNNTTQGGSSDNNFLPPVRSTDNAFLRFQDKRSSRIM